MPDVEEVRGCLVAFAVLGGVIALIGLAMHGPPHRPVPSGSNEVVTAKTTVSGGRNMADGGTAIVNVPRSSIGWNTLDLSLSLADPSGLGDCVLPARLTLSLSADAVVIHGVRSGESRQLDLTDLRLPAVLRVTLAEPDPGCRVDLQVSQAMFYN